MIRLHHVSFPPLTDISLSFTHGRYGIVGDNGMGKTTLLKLMAGEIKPEQGHIERQGTLHYTPQHREHSTLSGGEKTRTLLNEAFASCADILLLDEPSNSLDIHAKQQLLHWISRTQQCVIIVSHDRTLLDQMDHIIEITHLGIVHYGGNYTHYQTQKQQQQTAYAHDLEEAKRTIKKVNHSIQATKEKHAQRAKKGKSLRDSGAIDKMGANAKRGRSERSLSRNKTQADFMRDKAQAQWETASAMIEIKENINASLPHTHVPKGKTVLSIEHLHFAYSPDKKILTDIQLCLIGPQRMAITGNNGSGKTTLIKLIRGELTPTQGSITLGVEYQAYLDQQVSFLDGSKTILDNLCEKNPSLSTQEAYNTLARFAFRNRDALKIVSELSGGERVRAGLAVSLSAEHPPQLLILDEPTNHLDIRSIEAIENILSHYEGAMIVISHDQAFLDRLQLNTPNYHLGN